jgi:FimV-like protein
MILGLLSPGVALALGLGDIHVESALHQPLAAQIEIVGATSENSGTLSASIADQETFQRYGLERPSSLASTALTVRQDAQGHAYLLLRSTDTFTEPMVTFLVDLHTTSGELIREYTVLLDPPGMSSEHAAAAEIAAEQPSPVAAPAVAQTAEETAPAAAATVRQTTSDAAKPTRDTYTVARRDTLARIAGIAGAHSRSDRRKMMVAIFHANPSAFQTNLNNLRTGVTLHLPSVAELSSISSDAADREFAQQMAAWHSPEHRLAAAISSATAPIATAPVATSDASATAAASAIAAAMADTAANEAETTALTQRVESLEKSLYEVREKLQRPPVVQQRPVEQPATEATPAPVATRPQPADYPSDNYSSADEAPAPAPRHRMWFAPLLAKIGLMLGAGSALALTLAAAVWFYRRRNENKFVQSDIAYDAPDLRDPDSYRAAQPGDESLPFPKVDFSASYLVEEVKAELEHAHANAIARSESSTSSQAAASSEATAGSDPTARAEPATSSGSTTSTQTDARSTAVMGSEPAAGIKPTAGSGRTASSENLDVAAALAAAYELEASIEASANLPLSVTPAATDTSTAADQSEAPALRATPETDDRTNEMPTLEPTVKLALEPTMKLPAPRGPQETTAVLALHPDLTLDDTAAREFAFFNPESTLNTTHVMLAGDGGEAKAFIERRKNPVDVLRQAIEREPERSDLRLKLLELYYTAAAQNRRAFLEAVRQLAKNEKLATSNDWSQILDMGKAIAPDDELFNNGLEAVKKAVA